MVLAVVAEAGGGEQASVLVSGRVSRKDQARVSGMLPAVLLWPMSTVFPWCACGTVVPETPSQH